MSWLSRWFGTKKQKVETEIPTDSYSVFFKHHELWQKILGVGFSQSMEPPPASPLHFRRGGTATFQHIVGTREEIAAFYEQFGAMRKASRNQLYVMSSQTHVCTCYKYAVLTVTGPNTESGGLVLGDNVTFMFCDYSPAQLEWRCVECLLGGGEGIDRGDPGCTPCRAGARDRYHNTDIEHAG
jgi:hypothetical protein